MFKISYIQKKIQDYEINDWKLCRIYARPFTFQVNFVKEKEEKHLQRTMFLKKQEKDKNI